MPNNRGRSAVFELTRSARQVAALQDICECWHTGPEQFWPFESVLDALSRPGSLVLFAADSSESDIWHGSALIDVGTYSADLLYIYVRPEWRRTGVSRQLMEMVFATLKSKRQTESLFLEVRISNVEAQKFYYGLGMTLIGTRKRYYANGEDALIFKTDLQVVAGDSKSPPGDSK